VNNQKSFLKRIASIGAVLFLITGSVFAQTTTSGDAKQLWQLLDYVAVDYSGAVADGVIISEAEYAEMLDFTENAGTFLQSLPEHASKPWPKTGGVVDLTDKVRQRKLLALLPVDEVWGIGGKLTKRLQQLGINTALQLADADPEYIRQQFSVVVERTVRELNGESCIALEEMAPTKKQIVSSRAFGERITDKQQMREAISEYISRACKKLRQEQQTAKHLTVFLRTSPFSDKDAPYSASRSVELDTPTSDTRTFLTHAMKLLDGLWLNGYRYAKAGVMLADFYDPGVCQPGLFDEPMVQKETDQKLMQLMDTLNSKHSKTLWFASQGTKQEWGMKRELLSPAYTTNWRELPIAR
tara:strand:+ start:269 stop:1333 length:1065 start_codon:yes stop_codon:yes gene_type:complete